LQECRDWRITLEELYREYGVTIAMYEFCYLYVESENYCIGDVVRIRRKMLGMSQEKLCHGICDVRTLSRLEQNQKNTHKEIVQELFDRLNLSTELCRTELVTNNQEAIEKYRELRYENNNRNYARVKELISELKEMISMDIATNKQAILRKEIVNEFNCGELSLKDYIQLMKKALGCTVEYERVITANGRYLTNEEIACIHNITLKIDSRQDELKECISVLRSICEKINYPTNYLRMYEFIMATVSSHMGNLGEYDVSNDIKKRVLVLLLKNRKMRGIHEAIYGLLWNQEQKNKFYSIELKESILRKCIQISILDKDPDRKMLYENKMKNEVQKKSVPRMEN